MAILLDDADLTAWYNQLNTIRQKQNISLGTVSVPNVYKTKALSSTLNTFFNQINALKTNEYLQHAYGWNEWTAGIGDGVQPKEKIVSSLKTTIENQLDNLSLVCGNCIVTNRTSTSNSKTLNNQGGRMSFSTTKTTNTTVTTFDQGGGMSFSTTSFSPTTRFSDEGRMSFGTTATTNTTVTTFNHGGRMFFGTTSNNRSTFNHGGQMSFGTSSFAEEENRRGGTTTFGTTDFTRSPNNRDGRAGFSQSFFNNTSNQRCSFTARVSFSQTFNATRVDKLDNCYKAGFLPNTKFATTSGATFGAYTGYRTNSAGGCSERPTTTFGTSSFAQTRNTNDGTTTFRTTSFDETPKSHGGRMSFGTASYGNTPNQHGGAMSFSTTKTTNTTVTTFEHNGRMSFSTTSFDKTRNNHGGRMFFGTTATTNTTITTFDHGGKMSFSTSAFTHDIITTNVTKNMSFQVKDSTTAGQVVNSKIVN